MAVMLDQITIGELKILVLDDAPSSGFGYEAPLGSLAIVQGQPGIYQKTSSNATDWTTSSVNAEDVMDIIGAAISSSGTISLSYDDLAGTISAAIVAGSIDNSHINASAAIDASKIADGSVSNAEFQHLSNVTSDIQGQFDDLVSDVGGLQSELDATQTGAGLGTDGSYTAPVGSNYLGSAVSLKDADSKLDAQVKVVADDLAQEIIDRAADVDAEETRALAAEGAIQSELDATQTGAGLDSNGSYSAPIGSNYLGVAVSLKDADLKLDGEIKSVADDLAQEVIDRAADVDAEEARAIAAEGVLQSNIDAVQSELDATQTGAGLGATGVYVAPVVSNYLGSAVSLKDADSKLDAQIKVVADDLAQEVIDRAADVDAEEARAIAAEGAIQSELDATQTGAGLGTDGSYSAPVGSNYLGSAVSLKDADSKLDAQIKVVADDLAALDTYVDATFIPLSQKAAANGVATLGGDGKIPTAQLPALAITDVYVVANIAARDALTVEEGDVAKVSDAGSGLPRTYIYDGSSWIEIESGSDVDSVNGFTGAVVLTASDIGSTGGDVQGDIDALIAEDLTFLKLDGSRAMTGDLDLNYNDVLKVKSIEFHDGVDSFGSITKTGVNNAMTLSGEVRLGGVNNVIVAENAIISGPYDTGNYSWGITHGNGALQGLAIYQSDINTDPDSRVLLRPYQLSLKTSAGEVFLDANNFSIKSNLNDVSMWLGPSAADYYTGFGAGSVLESLNLAGTSLSDISLAGKKIALGSSEGVSLGSVNVGTYAYIERGTIVEDGVNLKISAVADLKLDAGTAKQIKALKELHMGSNKIVSVADPTSAQDAATKAYVDALETALDAEDLTFLKLDGSRPMSGNLDMDTNDIIDVGAIGIGSSAPDSVLEIVDNNVKFNVQGASTTTSGAVNAVIASVTPANNSVEMLKVFITGLDTTSYDSVSYERTVKVKNVGNTITLSTIQSDYTAEDPSLAAASTTFIISANSIDVRVTGVNSKNIAWKCLIQRVRSS